MSVSDQKVADIEAQSATESNENSTNEIEGKNSWERFVNSFKRSDGKQPFKRALKNRHIQMIAIGGSIGSGLFIGSGNSFKTGGPAAVIIGFCLIGAMLYSTMQALGEMAVRFPISGSFSVFSARFLDESWGFAMGWNYMMGWLFVYPLELIAAAVVISFWNTDDNGATNVNKAAWVGLFYVFIGAINLFGARGYGEAEFVLSTIKVLAILGFFIFGIVVAAGGGPDHHYYGAHYWYEPGAFANGFKGVISVFVNAAFAFGGTELTGLAAAETANPARSLPKAVKQVFWRIMLFYVVSLTIVSMLVPYTDSHLGSAKNGHASPFVIAILNTGVKGLPSVFNTVIIMSVLSVANSSVYGCSRSLCALATSGHAPKFLGYVDRTGRPLMAIIVTLLVGLLGFLSATSWYGTVFDWILAFCGLSFIFTWGSICLCHIRFRRGMSLQNHSLDELAFKGSLGVWGSWFGFLVNLAVVVLQFWIAVWPIGGGATAKSFFLAYLSVPVVVCFYLGHKTYNLIKGRPIGFKRAQDMDLISGMRSLDLEAIKLENIEEQARIKSRGFMYRTYKFWC